MDSIAGRLSDAGAIVRRERFVALRLPLPEWALLAAVVWA
jgi:hypothetical protein